MTHLLADLVLRFPKIALGVGVLFALLFGVMGVSSFLEMQKIGDAPERVTLAALAVDLNEKERSWVIVEDGIFNCESLHYEQVGSSEHTEIFVANGDASILMLVTYSGRLPCAELTQAALQGVAYRMSDKHASLLVDSGRLNAMTARSDLLELCSICGKSNSWGLVVLSLILGLASLSLYPLALWGRKRQIKKSDIVNTADEIFKN